MRRRKYKRKPKFKKEYRFDLQDDYMLEKERFLQMLHTRLAKDLFKELPKNVKGDWTLKTQGLTLFVDMELGSQLEIEGTSNLPFSQRFEMHRKLFKLLKQGYSIIKAVNLCLSTSTIQ